MPGVQTFWLEPTDQVALGLRRYCVGEGGFDCAHGHHHALVYTGERVSAVFVDDEHGRSRRSASTEDVDRTDPRWPTSCARCDYEFVDDDHWQVWDQLIWRRTDTGAERFNHSNPDVAAPDVPIAEPGACWDASWMPFSRGPDGICLIVRCPDGHDWTVDSQASNCTRPGEPHQCWVRHGDPRECHVTVDKNGDTCSAGAGSIDTGTWHGFLRDGVLVA